MSKRIIQVSAGVVVLMMLAMPVLVLARVEPLPTPRVTGVDQIIGILDFVVRIIFTLLMIAAIAFIFLAAYRYLTAGGDATKMTAAHMSLLSAAIAIAVALLATGVRAIVEDILRGGRGVGGGGGGGGGGLPLF
jgi:hypothetical protein